MFALTEKQINTLAALAESKEGFEATERSLQEAAKALQLEYPRLAPLLAVVQFLYGHARAARIDESEAARQVCDFAEQLGIEDARAKAPAIARLFAKKEAYDRHVLVQSAKRAVVPTLLGVSIASDIRAVTDPTTDVILGYVPVTLVGLDLTSADRGADRVQFQLAGEDLDMLMGELQKAQRLVVYLTDEFGDKILGADAAGSGQP